MSKTFIPEGYESSLSLYQTQDAIGLMKKLFEEQMKSELNLIRVSAPLFVRPTSGLNDDLNGFERAVEFDIKETGENVAIVHSLAKWKRMALWKYDFKPGQGLYTDMNAIRRDEDMDNIHSIYVDQWDWEKVILREDRTEEYLKDTVSRIVKAICNTLDHLKKKFPQITVTLNPDVKFVTTQELEDMYPDNTPKERENLITEKYGTVFIMKIGDVLKSGNKHDGRAPDYDDWALNGDIMFYNPVLKRGFEISSMGIRVDAESLAAQLKKSGCEERRELPFHKMLLDDTLPLSIGGGIGQSRLSMLLLGKAHIGEVQVSVWDDETEKECREAGIVLL